jgi:hypothetical protein
MDSQGSFFPVCVQKFAKNRNSAHGGLLAFLILIQKLFVMSFAVLG